MTKRQVITICAHSCLALALISMILEAELIGKLWGNHYPHAILVASYCGMLVATMLSFFAMFKTGWAWPFTATLLFVYSDFSVPEGTEDLREICRALLSAPEDVKLLLLRLAFTLFLFVPLGAFLFLAGYDVRGLLRRRAERRNRPDAKDRPGS